MKNYPHQIHLFDQYLRKELSEQEALTFEKQLVEDPALQQAFRLHKAIIAAAKGHGENYERVAAIQKEVKAKRKVRTIKILVAAAAMLVMAFGLWFIMASNPSLDQLMAEYHTPPAMDSKKGITEDDYNKIFEAYYEKDYQKTLKIYQKTPDGQSDTRLHLPIAYAYQATAQYPRALQLYNEIIQKNHPDAQKARWYKTLLQIKQENWPEAKAGLQYFIKDENTSKVLKNKAKKLLEAIN